MKFFLEWLERNADFVVILVILAGIFLFPIVLVLLREIFEK